ncbi:MAG: hypothetical protein QNJ53_19495 [Pleurocapsa sp. MO_192.B19]|nr:hypothetical protein [Pleurocapsa sp. MO_192.B19]
MGLYRVKNQWGGSSAPWRQGGQWTIGNRPKQDVIALNIKSNDGGKTLKGTMTYKGEGPIGFLATKESKGIDGVFNQDLQLRIKQLETDLKTQQEKYEKLIDQQKKAYEESIENLKNVTESETKATIIEAIEAAKKQAKQAEADILIARQKQRRAEILSILTSKILDINESEDRTEVLQEEIALLAVEARKITLKAVKSPPDSAMAITAHNSAQQVIELAATAEQHLANLKEQQASAKATLEEQKNNLERLNVENNQEEQKPSEVIDTAEMTLKQLEAEGGSLAASYEHTMAAIASKEKAELALLLAVQQAQLASEAYDNWATIEGMFGFSEPDENSDNNLIQEPDNFPDTFPDYDNWQVIGDMFGISDNPVNPEATQTESSAAKSSN